MSKRTTRNVSFPCNKRRFRDKKEAVASLHFIDRISPEDHHRPVRAYCCPKCKGWHLTSRPGRGKVARRGGGLQERDAA